MTLRGLLFDLDGTLVHTDPLHFRAWRETLRTRGVELDEEAYARRVSGRHNPEIVAELLPDLSATEGRTFSDAKEARFRELATELTPLPGVHSLLRAARAGGLRTAVVTNAPRDNAVFMLDALGLSDHFDVLALAEDAAAAKPDPAPYLEVLARLGLTPDEALAFEDSPSGIRSARGAGLRVVGVATTQPRAVLAAQGAARVIMDFQDERLWAGPLAFLHPHRGEHPRAEG